MRILALLLFFFLLTHTSAQVTLRDQIKSIIADSSGGFQEFRKTDSVVFNNSDSVFLSAILLEGTTHNKVSRVLPGKWVYSALIADSVKENKAKKICDEWKEKMAVLLGSEFTVYKYHAVSYNPSKYGWRFSDGNVVVSLDVMPDGKERNINWLWLSITN